MSIFEIFSLAGGIGLFLFGMTVMSSGLKNACGNNLQTILEKATRNKIIAVLVGVGMTMLIQSSSATDVMVIGFVNSGMMNLVQAIGVIMGANIGTTITAQITAFNLSAYAPLILFIGAVMFLFMKKHLIKYIGEVIMGFGMLFLGISIMKTAITPLAEMPQFVRFISGLENPALAVIFGILFTALLQSSSSSIVIFQAFAIEGLLDYHTAVYLIIGAAIGSVTPNILASLTTNRQGKRSAVLNLLFNVFRAGILIALINAVPALLTLIQNLSPGDVGRQIANTHTIFAIIAVLIELPFSNKIIVLAEKIIPIREEENEMAKDRKLQYMVNLSAVPASMAIGQTHREVVRMGHIAIKNLAEALECFFEYDEEKAQKVRNREDSVDILNREIGDGISNLRDLNLTLYSMRRVSNLAIAVTDMERLSDHAENIVEYVERLRSQHKEISEEGLTELRQMADDTLAAVNLALEIFANEDYSKLDEIEALEQRVDDQEDQLINRHVKRSMAQTCDPISGIVFTDLVTDLERCADHAINIAYALKARVV